MLFSGKKAKKPSVSEERVLKNGIAVIISRNAGSANEIWKVSVESKKPLEEFRNIGSRIEADFIADQLYRKYEHFDLLMQVER